MPDLFVWAIGHMPVVLFLFAFWSGLQRVDGGEPFNQYLIRVFIKNLPSGRVCEKNTLAPC